MKTAVGIALFFVMPTLAQSATLHVDGSAANDGNGSAAQPFKYLQSALPASACGDTISVKAFSGVYYNAIGGSGFERYSFDLNGKTCSAGSPLTILGADRNNKPTLCSNASCTPNVNSTLGTSGTAAYVILDGLHINGHVGFINPSRADHITLRYSDLEGGFMCDGNYNILYLSDTTHAHLHHNSFHDLNAGSCSAGNGHWTLLKTFRTQYDLHEFNTYRQGSGHSLTWALDLKDCTYFDTYRYNDIGGSMAVNRQTGCSGRNPQGTEIYGNLFRGGHLMPKTDLDVSLPVHHNTFTSGSLFWSEDSFGPVTAATVRDNIIHSPSNPDYASANVNIQSADWPYRTQWTWDYNIYAPSGIWVGAGSTYGSLAAWQSAFGSPRDSHSQAITCSFDADWRVNPGTPCKTASSNGGEVGAYGVTDCVGHTCGAPPDTTPPAAPRNLSVQP